MLTLAGQCDRNNPTSKTHFGICMFLTEHKQHTEQYGTEAQKELDAVPDYGTDQHKMPSATDCTLQQFHCNAFTKCKTELTVWRSRDDYIMHGVTAIGGGMG
jgi:hypothetical protein